MGWNACGENRYSPVLHTETSIASGTFNTSSEPEAAYLSTEIEDRKRNASSQRQR